MDNLNFDATSYIQNGKRITLISGDIHYFRIPRDQWRDRLEKLKAQGANCVSTYIPWMLYEVEEGTFIEDNPQYDLEAYLELCKELGLWVSVRPGPYQYSELQYDGLPGWIFEKHPEMLAQDITGSNFGAVSYLQPAYMEKTRQWFGFIIPKIARHQVTRGGCVVTIQIDNELMGVHAWNSGWDYNPDSMGVGREEGRWPDYLKSKYGTVSAANEAFELNAGTWSEIMPAASVTSGSLSERRRLRDYQECYFRSIADYAEIQANWMREDGIDIVFVHNAAGPNMSPFFNEVASRLGNENFILGVDHYYNLTTDWPQNNPTPKFACEVFRSLELLRLRGYPPTVFEMQGGSLSDFPPITAVDLSCNYMTNVAYGMKGFNTYVSAGGVNPDKYGKTCDNYDYGAGIAPDGTLRELYYAQKKVASFYLENDWLPQASRINDCNIGLVWDYTRSETYCAERKGGLLFANFEAVRLLNKGLIETSFCSSLSPNIVDLIDSDIDTSKPLMVASATTMPRKVQENLVAFLKAGGKLLIAPVIPTLDEDFNSCTVLADYIGACEQKQLNSYAYRINAFDVNNVYVMGSKYESTVRPDDSIVTIEDEISGKTLGWKKSFASGGIVSLMGIAWIQSVREHEKMLRSAMSDLDIKPVVKCSNPSLWTSLRSDGEHSALFVMNLFTSPMETKLSYVDPKTGSWVDVGELKIPGMSAYAWVDGKWVYTDK